MKMEVGGDKGMRILGRPSQEPEGGEWQLDQDDLAWDKPKSVYCVPVLLGEPEPEGIPVWCPTLPGVASYGKNVQETMANIGEALLGAIEEYRASGQEIPWQPENEPSLREDKKARWVWVNVK